MARSGLSQLRQLLQEDDANIYGSGSEKNFGSLQPNSGSIPQAMAEERQ
jgi:hypothetical protein